MKYFGLIFLVISSVLSAKTVHSLGEIPQHIKHSAGKTYWEEQMVGAKPQDYFGRDFFADKENYKKILFLIDPKLLIEENWKFMGVRPWPRQPDTYIFTACSTDEKDKKYDFDVDYCHYLNTGKTVFAVIKIDKDNNISLIAKPWIDDGNNTEKTAFLITNDQKQNVTGNPIRLDFAPYQLSSEILAFGVRHNAMVGYSGGGAIDEAMTLFAVIDGQLLPILNVPTYHFADYAGSWHKDGTRNHDIYENLYIIRVLSSSTSGMNDLAWSEVDGKKKHTSVIYKWDNVNKRYIKQKAKRK